MSETKDTTDTPIVPLMNQILPSDTSRVANDLLQENLRLQNRQKTMQEELEALKAHVAKVRPIWGTVVLHVVFVFAFFIGIYNQHAPAIVWMTAAFGLGLLVGGHATNRHWAKKEFIRYHGKLYRIIEVK